MLHIPIRLNSKFQLQQTYLIFWNKFPQKGMLPVENRKNECHHSIPPSRMSLSTKAQL